MKLLRQTFRAMAAEHEILLAAPDFTAHWADTARASYIPEPDAALRERYRRFTAGMAAAL